MFILRIVDVYGMGSKCFMICEVDILYSKYLLKSQYKGIETHDITH